MQDRLRWHQDPQCDEVEALKQQNKHIRERYEHERSTKQALERELAQVRGERRMPEASRGGYRHQVSPKC